MIDRLIAGAGAVSAALDRVVRRLLPGTTMDDQPASLLAAGLLGVIALVLVVSGAGASGSPTLQTLDPAAIAQGRDVGDNVYATLAGRVPSSYVESYADKNGNDVQDPDEVGGGWDYFLLGSADDAGVIVRSEQPPSTIFTYRTSGVVKDGADYIKTDIDALGSQPSIPGIVIDPTQYIDARVPVDGTPLDLSGTLPASETAVTIDAARLIEYFTVCSADPNNDGTCSPDEVDLYDVIAYDPASGHAVVVITATPPAFEAATFTGILRQDPREVTRSLAALGTSPEDMGFTISPTYLLQDGGTPTDTATMYALAVLALLVAAIVVLGVVGGYVRFRPAGTLPAGAATLAPGERIPVRVTGILIGPAGRVHVRDTAADLVRFVLEPAAAVDAAPPPAGGPEPEPAADPEPGPRDVTTTLVVERRDREEGVALGIGELTDLAPGTVVTFGAQRPGLRATAGTGRVELAFDDAAARDRAAAELVGETGVGTVGASSAPPTISTPTTAEEDA